MLAASYYHLASCPTRLPVNRKLRKQSVRSSRLPLKKDETVNLVLSECVALANKLLCKVLLGCGAAEMLDPRAIGVVQLVSLLLKVPRMDFNR